MWWLVKIELKMLRYQQDMVDWVKSKKVLMRARTRWMLLMMRVFVEDKSLLSICDLCGSLFCGTISHTVHKILVLIWCQKVDYTGHIFCFLGYHYSEKYWRLHC